MYVSRHACEQIFVRYGLTPTKQDWRSAFLDITNFKTLLAAREGNVEVHYLLICGQSVRVIYSPSTATIVTALPLGPRRRKRIRSRPSKRHFQCSQQR